MPNPANRFHSWLYRARPDLNCIVHSHAPHASALAMLEVPLTISHMDTCVLYDQTAFLEKWPGIPVGNEEGEIISTALGDKKAILLSHHGLLVAGSSVEEACVLGVMFERAARLQLLAMAAAKSNRFRRNWAAKLSVGLAHRNASKRRSPTIPVARRELPTV